MLDKTAQSVNNEGTYFENFTDQTWRDIPMNSQWRAYQDSEAFAARVATLYGAGEKELDKQKARYG